MRSWYFQWPIVNRTFVSMIVIAFKNIKTILDIEKSKDQRIVVNSNIPQCTTYIAFCYILYIFQYLFIIIRTRTLNAKRLKVNLFACLPN